MTSLDTVIDRLTLVAPLGLRFWDEATSSPVGADLVVIAHPAGDPLHGVRAVANSDGIYGFPSLPGLAISGHGRGDAEYWANLPKALPFIIDVTDAAGRFLPCRFAVTAPARFPFVLDCLASPPAAPAIPLYSAPSRRIPQAMAVLRAELQDMVTGGPAAWAVLEARVAGQALVRGVADSRGRVALIVPYPEPATGVLGSPPSSPPVAAVAPLIQQEWVVQIQAAYEPLHPVPAVPDLCTTLNQLPASLWTDSGGTVPLTQAVLQFGRELVLRPSDVAVPGPDSALRITPAGSPV